MNKKSIWRGSVGKPIDLDTGFLFKGIIKEVPKPPEPKIKSKVTITKVDKKRGIIWVK